MNFDLQQHIENLLQKKDQRLINFKWKTIGGGSINDTYKITTNLESFFIKINTSAVFKNGFKEEVLGLKFLNKHTANTPKILLEGVFNEHIYLVLEWIECGNYSPTFWKNFALSLTKLHKQHNSSFGLDYGNYMGELPQQNYYYSNFSEFFIQNRLLPQITLAFNQNKLQKSHLSKFQNLYPELDAIFPKEKPSVVHGDLWSGNFICAKNDMAFLIDPAVYYGHREIDLSMTHLFGGFSTDFYSYYQENYPLEKGFSNRIGFYNLYPLLIHLNLFGSSYLRPIENIITKF